MTPYDHIAAAAIFMCGIVVLVWRALDRRKASHDPYAKPHGWEE